MYINGLNLSFKQNIKHSTFIQFLVFSLFLYNFKIFQEQTLTALRYFKAISIENMFYNLVRFYK